MANPEHLAILMQGVERWNQWREDNIRVSPDLSGANLCGADLCGALLCGTEFTTIHFIGGNYIFEYIPGADLTGANLTRANLNAAALWRVNLTRAHLGEADLSNSVVGGTIFADVDLSATKGLETIKHLGPSTIGIHAIYRSQGKIPEAFLRGCGVPDQLITYIPSLVGQAIQYYSCFISYSSKDQVFAERLHADLQSKGVRCWFAPEDMKIGDKFRFRIDESIRVHEKLLLILSENSVASDWVEKEVETAMEKERESKKPVLVPVQVDDSVNAIKSGWVADVRRTRHIGDFSKWKSHDEYRKVFERLLRDLKIERDSSKLG